MMPGKTQKTYQFLIGFICSSFLVTRVTDPGRRYTYYNELTAPASSSYTHHTRSFPGHTPNFADFAEKYCKNPLLTLVTTTNDSKDRRRIHENVIRNWAYFAPCLRPVLMVRDTNVELRNASSLAYFALSHGWDVTTYNRTKNGLPILKDMLLDSQKASDVPFVGYANADIIFDYGLIRTIYEVQSRLPNLDKTEILISGIRTNGKIKTVETMDDLWMPTNVARMAEAFSLCRSDSADYFIFSRAGFHWDQVPDFVPARPRFDSWFLGTAVQRDIFHVDTTATVTALHQASRIKPAYMRRASSMTFDINQRMAGEDKYKKMCYVRRLCRHECSKYVSVLARDRLGYDTIQIEHRERDRSCRIDR